MKLLNFVENQWVEGKGDGNPLYNAVNGEVIHRITSDGIAFEGLLNFGRTVGGSELRKLTFHQRALILKALAKYLLERKDHFYKISQATGATKIDSWIDIEGGIGTLFSYSGIGRRELPNEKIFVEGGVEPLSKTGSFVGRHIMTPLRGAAIHINAFNFPCWGMLEKFAPTFLAGMPSIIKPASATAYLTEAMVKSMIESGLLPKGSLQLICGSVGDLLSHVSDQDVVTFTGSAETGKKLKTLPSIIENSTRFNMEADSLNCCILGNDITPKDEEFKLFIKEVSREMTVKAGQKCTAIRRIIVPSHLQEDVIKSLDEALDKIKMGDPQSEGVKMGPLASPGQVEDVKRKVEALREHCELVYGNPGNISPLGDNVSGGAFFPSLLLRSDKPLGQLAPHEIEAFGPVSTVMPYENFEEACELAKLGKGSLVGSLFTRDGKMARDLLLETASYHGRFLVLNSDCSKESTGHGSPLPNLVHGGPGRAGGGEEMGGLRGVLHYMQRTAIQGGPTELTTVCREYLPGGKPIFDRVHPFRKYFEELQVGETLITPRRTVAEADIVNFAGVSGDYFYAHMDELAAKDSLFEKRVAHGYFVLSAAAGLFVDPGVGPVLANYGLDNLRFVEPVAIGDTIQVKISVKRKTRKPPREGEPETGVVAWYVEVSNQREEIVAIYDILTLVACKEEGNLVV